jgi:hypothetical protein
VVPESRNRPPTRAAAEESDDAAEAAGRRSLDPSSISAAHSTERRDL